MIFKGDVFLINLINIHGNIESQKNILKITFIFLIKTIKNKYL